MAIHATAKKRITILATIVAIFAITIGGLWFYRQNQNQKRIDDLQVKAKELYQQGDYRQALDPMRSYVRNNPDDIQAVYELADIYENVPQPGGRNIAAAIATLRQVVERDPTYKDAATRLLDYYVQFQQNDDALLLIKSIMDRDPNNLDALQAQAIIDSRLRRFDQALVSVNKVLENDPDNFRMELLKAEIQQQLDVPAQQIVDEALALAKQNPDDPRYDLILAYAYRNAQNREKSLEYLNKAATNPPIDTEYINTLVRFLDGFGEFNKSIDVLQKTIPELNDPILQEALIVRLMENARYADALELIGSINPESPASSLRMVMYQTIAYRYTDKLAEAKNDIDALINRKGDTPANTLGVALQDIFDSDEQSPKPEQVIEAIEEALKHHPNYAYLYLFLGDNYGLIQETNNAIDAWQNAARLRPTWAQPLAQLALAYLSQGKTAEAQALATAAAQRNPSNAAIVSTWALTAAANIKPGQKDAAQEILNVIKQLENRGVQGNQLLLMQLTLLEKTGDRDKAKEIIESTLSEDKDINEQTLLTMATLSRAMRLDIADKIYDKTEAKFGITPQLALARATYLESQDQGNKAEEYLETQFKQHSDKDKLNWEIARATFYRIISDPRATEAWETIATNYPDNVRAQQLALRALASDPNANKANIEALDRLEKLTGSDNIEVKIERARILLSDNNPDRDAERAIKILDEVTKQSPDRIEPRLLLARAYEETGRTPLAMRELSNIAKNNPDNPRVAIELAQLYQSVRSFSSATNQLDIIRKSPVATTAQLSRTAQLYAAQGEERLAIATLDRIKNELGNLPDTDRLLAAEMYRRTDQAEKLNPILAQITTSTNPQELAWAADYYATSGNKPQADLLVAKLKEQTGRDNGLAEQLLAAYAARHSSIDEALNYDIQRTQKQPNDPNAWKQLIARYVTNGDAEDAIAAAKQGLSSIPNQPSLKAITTHEQAIQKYAAQDIYQPIILDLLGSAEDRQVANTVLSELMTADQNEMKARDFADILQPIADKHPSVIALQNLLAELYLITGSYEEALNVADRASVNFPQNPTPVRISTDTHMALGEWNDAIISANQWKTRNPDASLLASLRIATAQIQINQPYNAIRTLNPYIEQAKTQPSDFPQLISIYGRALSIDNRITQAAEFYEPLFDDNPNWRIDAMRSAALATKNPKAIVSWLNRIGDKIPPSDLEQRAILAESLWDIGNKFDMTEVKTQASNLIDNIVTNQNAPASAWFVRGVINESEGKLADASDSYREAIKLNPEFAAAKNNLAFILIQQSQVNQEAATLAEQAVNASPSNPSFLDTLAAVQAANKEYKKAIETQKRAIALDPNNPLWKLNLLQIYDKAGLEQDASDLRHELETRGIQVPQPPTTQKN